MTSADPTRVIDIVRSWLGTHYQDQASLRGVGCDCLGLARGVWREVVGPDCRASSWDRRQPVDGAALRCGAIVLAVLLLLLSRRQSGERAGRLHTLCHILPVAFRVKVSETSVGNLRDA